MLKTCAPQLAPAMATIFQASIDTGKLPNDWLNANIAHVFKKGDVHLPQNYRSVSLTCVSCKLLEHIICKHILDHLERNKILTTLNHGSSYSCETQLVATVHDLLGKFDVGAQIDMVILDFSKAFDTVPHQKLLHKMGQYGVDGNFNAWLCDFLTNRKMRVVIDGEESETVPVDSARRDSDRLQESRLAVGLITIPSSFLCLYAERSCDVTIQIQTQEPQLCVIEQHCSRQVPPTLNVVGNPPPIKSQKSDYYQKVAKPLLLQLL